MIGLVQDINITDNINITPSKALGTDRNFFWSASVPKQITLSRLLYDGKSLESELVGSGSDEISLDSFDSKTPFALIVFIATLKGFYFDKCDKIIRERTISRLGADYVPKAIQEKYQKTLGEFLKEK